MKMARLPNGDVIPDRRNGANGITYKWLVGVLLIILLGVGSWWLTSVWASVDSNTDRISRLEVTILGMDKQINKIDRNIEKLLNR